MAIGVSKGTEINVDNITIHSDSTSGYAVTQVVDLPYNRWWDLAELSKDEPGASSVTFSVMEPYTNKVLWSHENLTAASEDVSDVSPWDSDRIYLVIWLQAKDGDFPSVDWWRLSWKPDPPVQDRDLPDVHLLEDVPGVNVTLLRDYFHDYYVVRANLTFEVFYASEPAHVLPVIEGQYLSIQLPERDWYGSATARVLCSDGEFTVESNEFTVTVAPMDDPPVIAGLGTFTAVEGADSVLDLEPFLSDVDTPLEGLAVEVSSSNCTVDGRTLVFNYTVGDVQEDVAVWVSDATSRVAASLAVTVTNVNDPPEIVMEVARQFATEGEPLTVQLGNYLYDEDDPVDSLVVACEDPYVTSVQGQSITFLHDEWVDLRTVVFTVYDGEATVAGSFLLQVAPVNDPPVVESVGGQAATGPLGFAIDERSDAWLPIVATDVDGPELDYAAESDWEGAVAFPNGMLHISSAGGDVGEHPVLLVVTDGAGGRAEVPITVAVVDVNDPPVVTTSVGAVVRATEDVPFRLALEAEDPEGDAVIWSDDSDALDVDPSTGVIAFTPAQADVGTHHVNVTATDARGGVTRLEFDLVVENINDAPVIVSVAPANGSTYKQGEAVPFRAVATDEDGDAVAYTWTEGGVIIGTGPELDYDKLEPGTRTVRLEVSDRDSSVTRDVTVEVEKKAEKDEPGLTVDLAILVLIVLAILIMHWRRRPISFLYEFSQ